MVFDRFNAGGLLDNPPPPKRLQTVACAHYYSQASSLRGVGVTATVEEAVKGVLPPFDQGTVGINVLSLGSAEVRREQTHIRLYQVMGSTPSSPKFSRWLEGLSL